MCAVRRRQKKRRVGRASRSAPFPGIGDFAAELLYQEGFKSAEDVADSEVEEILDVEGISKDKAEAAHKSAREYVAEKRRLEQEAHAAAQEPAAPSTEAQFGDGKETQEP